ncbi:chemotaxis protein CheW [Massilia sp. CCM 8734]|uniref:chemotaxis protein CheW n=1 Tax=Massilia sp. CCM 8734 TaxID=2609283 RepID=UPI001421AC93|nr:chemotaxis protein CheW [Massilia sp. CCM 8734]NHZ96393.1 chemotaxis protein CheW [Massilia sp. CCM 8734]
MNLDAPLIDCWNKIGVQGDRTCPELEKVIHCRNCPVYSAAAARLLDSDLPEGYVDERTGHYAQPQRDALQATGAFTLFRIGAEWLCLPAAAVTEVAGMRAIHVLPHRPPVVLGVANVRGALLICVSLAHLLGVEQDAVVMEGEAISYRRLVVLAGEQGRLVFPVDEMHGIERFSPEALQPVPATLDKAASTYTSAMLAWGERSVGCLDAGLVLYGLQKGLA